MFLGKVNKTVLLEKLVKKIRVKLPTSGVILKRGGGTLQQIL